MRKDIPLDTPEHQTNNQYTALKQKKKGPQDMDEEDLAFKQKQKEAEAARKAAAANVKGGKPLVGGGIKKSGKK